MSFNSLIFSGNSLNVITTETKGKHYSEKIIYRKIKLNGMTSDKLRTLLVQKNVQKPNIVDFQDYFLFQYGDKKPLFINKKDGRVYGQTDDIQERITAIRLLRILNSYGLVEGFRRIQYHKQHQIQWS